jgi:hypothetical protein
LQIAEKPIADRGKEQRYGIFVTPIQYDFGNA